MSSQHTPGPWLKVPGHLWVEDSRGRHLALAQIQPGSVNTVQEDSANARLIAAAPELLAALRVAEDLIGGNATGRDPLIGSNEQQRRLEEIRAAIAKATQS